MQIVIDPNPIEWLHKTYHNRKQSLLVYEVVRICTYNDYYTSIDEKIEVL